MTTRFGYACLNMTLGALKPRITCNRGMIRRTFDAKGIPYASELALQNVTDLVSHIQWNHEHGIEVFRITSCLFPWASEYKLQDLPDYEQIVEHLQQAMVFPSLLFDLSHQISIQFYLKLVNGDWS